MGLLLGMLTVRDAKAVGVSYAGDPAILTRIGGDAALVGPADPPS
jgi:hypothetical protein